MGSALFLAFSATAAPVLVAAGLLLEWQARRALEEELARRVESLAVAVSAAIPPETWELLFSLGPGEEESRTARHVRSRLTRIAEGVGAERMAVWTVRGEILLDTATQLRIGSQAPRAALMQAELTAAAAGGTTSTPLFHTATGRPLKIGMAPIALKGRAAPGGVLLVEAPPHSLAVVASMRRTLLMVGLAGWLLVLLVALWLARGLTRRISLLTGAARQIGRGDLESPVPALGEDELGYLAGALDRMRAGVRVRERQLRAMVGGVAHEIRNPLGGLTLYAEMLARDDALSEEQGRRAGRVLEEAVRLERVVADFLNYARPARPQPETLDLAPILEQCVQNAAAGVAWPGECQVVVGTEQVSCDPDHLRQVLLNLLRNAMQAAGDQGRVRAAVRSLGEAIEVWIDDSGSGIPVAERELVFEPFRSGKPQGAGLGLAIAKRLCDLGEVGIGVASSELGGARFWLRFQRHPGE
jgi:signal transduction histidine kinase